MTTETERRIREEWVARTRSKNTALGREAIAQAKDEERQRIAEALTRAEEGPITGSHGPLHEAGIRDGIRLCRVIVEEGRG